MYVHIYVFMNVYSYRVNPVTVLMGKENNQLEVLKMTNKVLLLIARGPLKQSVPHGLYSSVIIFPVTPGIQHINTSADRLSRW